MSESRLPRDDNGHPMQTMPKASSQSVTVNQTTSNRSTALNGSIVQVRADVACFVKRGDSAVTGTTTMADDVIPLFSGEWADIDLPADKKYLAPLVASGSGTLYIIDSK